MDDRGGASGGDDDFPTEIRALAEEVKALAVKKRVEEINDDRGYQNGARSGQAGPPGSGLPLIESGDSEYRALEETYKWIPGVFERFTRPDPAGFQPMIDLLYPVLHTFGPDPGADSGGKSSKKIPAGAAEPSTGSTAMGEINSLAKVNWDGKAGENFDKFTSRFTLIKDNQREVARVLRRSMLANQAIFVESRTQVRKIAKSTKKALVDSGEFGGSDAAVTCAVGAAVLAVLGALAAAGSGGALTPVVLAGAGGAASVLGTFASETKDIKIAAHTVEDVLQNMWEALSETSTQISDTEFTISRWLDSNYESITSSGSRKDIIAPRPDLANVNASNLKDRFKPPY